MATRPITLHRISSAQHIKAQLTRGANPNEPDQWQRTPLHTLATEDATCAALLIEAGSHIDARDDLGRTPIFYLANIAALVEAGADVNARDRDGRTPLHMAISSDRASALLQAGADIGAEDNDGKTPAQTTGPSVAPTLHSWIASRAIQQQFTSAGTTEKPRKPRGLML